MLDKLYLSVCSIFILKRLRHRGKTSRGCCSKVKPIRSTEKTFITLGIRTCHKDARTCHVLHCIVARFFFTQSWKSAHSRTWGCWMLLTHRKHYISIVQTSLFYNHKYLFFKAVIIFYPIDGLLCHLQQGTNIALDDTSI